MKHAHSHYYHSCVKSILQDLVSVDQNALGHKMFVHSHGFMHLHFKLSLIIGNTKGHNKLCGHYCSYSSNIQQMCKDCIIPQCDGDDPQHPCQFVDAESIKMALRECIPIINGEDRLNVANARE